MSGLSGWFSSCRNNRLMSWSCLIKSMWFDDIADNFIDIDFFRLFLALVLVFKLNLFFASFLGDILSQIIRPSVWLNSFSHLSIIGFIKLRGSEPTKSRILSKIDHFVAFRSFEWHGVLHLQVRNLGLSSAVDLSSRGLGFNEVRFRFG